MPTLMVDLANDVWLVFHAFQFGSMSLRRAAAVQPQGLLAGGGWLLLRQQPEMYQISEDQPADG